MSLVESMFGGGDGDEKMPVWAKIIVTIIFIIFVLPVIIIAVPMLALALVALIYGEKNDVPAPVKDGVDVVKETFGF